LPAELAQRARGGRQRGLRHCGVTQPRPTRGAAAPSPPGVVLFETRGHSLTLGGSLGEVYRSAAAPERHYSRRARGRM
jgi:hypothetical protein